MFLKKLWRYLWEDLPARTVWKSLMIQFCLEMGLLFSGVFSKDMQAQCWVAAFALGKLVKLYLNTSVARLILYMEYFALFWFLSRQQ